MNEIQSISEEESPSGHPVVLFDGTCNFCSLSVQFILRNERDSNLHFATLQSEVGQQRLMDHDMPRDRMDSMILIDQEQAYDCSDAALRVLQHLRAPWRWARIFVFVPKPIRDWCYRILAKNRYRIFGQSEVCMVPKPELKSRFLS
ncbi:MAG: thiol-disulfide oxidoreductase DCC family protein [Planctomycetota bacterium]|nr:thiol-disulfide oxidoreductase DCC family protein [Planctomycetota bacterium]